jgi:release factor glutamine methyltransferase
MQTTNELLRDCAQELEGAGFVHGQREAEIILGHLTGMDTAKLFTHGDEPVATQVISRAKRAVQERVKGRPLAYIVGTQSFLGFHLNVDERALIPRPETEQLVELVVKRLRERRLGTPKVLEVGTGAGAIAIALKKYFPAAAVTATDISEEALELAQDNAQKLGAAIEFVPSDLLKSLPQEKFDVVIANLPYVPSERLSFVTGEILDWEPLVAIEATGDGFGYIRELLQTLKPYLSNNALIALEMWHTHGPLVEAVAAQALTGSTVEISQDLAGFDRFALIETGA